MTFDTEHDENSGDYQRPRRGGRIWRFFLFVLLALILAAYPIAMAWFHNTTNRIPDTAPVKVWADQQIGTGIELLEREGYFGWATSRPAWHPQAQLTAMPAFQRGVSDTVSALAESRKTFLGDSGSDNDLQLAHLLLSELQGRDANDKLRAAMEALRRFDGRKARALVADVSDEALLRHDLTLYDDLLSVEIEHLRQLAGQKTRGVFNRENVRLYYHAKGVIYASGVLLRSYRNDDFDVAGFAEARQNMSVAFDRAARPAPITVSNGQPGEFSIGGNDVMELAYLAMEARTAIRTLADLMNDADPPADSD